MRSSKATGQCLGKLSLGRAHAPPAREAVRMSGQNLYEHPFVLLYLSPPRAKKHKVAPWEQPPP